VTMTGPFKTATPERAIKPTAAEMERGWSGDDFGEDSARRGETV
jgi:hypothetical protein